MTLTLDYIRTLLEKGAFIVRRGDNHFSRCPVDLVLESPVNADAASRLTGLSAATMQDYGG